MRELVQQDEGSWPTEFRVGATIPASDYLRAQQVRTMLQREMQKLFTDIDLYINIPYSGPTLAYTNLTGHPTLIARCGYVDDFPVMLEYVGALYREDAICRTALAYEQSTDGSEMAGCRQNPAAVSWCSMPAQRGDPET